MSARRVGHQVTMDWRRCHAGHRCLCRAGPLWGSRPPLPVENLEISPLRLLHCFRGSHPLRTRARHLCARSAGLTRRRKIPPSAEPRHLVVYRIRSGPVPAGDSFQYQGCRSSTIPSRACPDTSSMMSSMRCEQCVELVALSVLCVQRPGERRGSQTCLGIFVPPSLPGVRFVPRFGWGELRRFTKSEATITTILTANLPFGSSALDVFRLPGPPQADSGRQRASRLTMRKHDDNTSPLRNPLQRGTNH